MTTGASLSTSPFAHIDAKCNKIISVSQRHALKQKNVYIIIIIIIVIASNTVSSAVVKLYQVLLM